MSSNTYRLTPDAEASDIDLEVEEFLLPDGTRLTEERAAELAATAERRRANLVPGRKSLSKNGEHSPVLQVRLAADTRDELDARAKAQGISVSKYTRELIERSLKAS